MAESHSQIPREQTTSHARAIDEVDKELIAAWQAAMGLVAESGRPRGVFTTKEICEHVLKYRVTDHFVRKTRDKIREWIADKKVQIVWYTVTENTTRIDGKATTLHAYKLADNAEEWENVE